MRAVHTLKGNCGMFGIGSVAQVAHRLESFIVESGMLPSAEQCLELARVWRKFEEHVRRLSGDAGGAIVEVALEELSELEAATEARASYAKIAELLCRLKFERGIVRLRRIAERAKALAEKLGKCELNVELEASADVRFQSEHWAHFWSAFVHVVHNAVDHGVELPEERLAAGKSAHAKLSLSTQSDAEALSVEISDDGRGIDWLRVRAKAEERGLAHAVQNDLTEALFSNGLSTADGVTEVSGRGVGMGAARDAARALGGTMTVLSTLGEGTTIRFRFPRAPATELEINAEPAGSRGILLPASAAEISAA